MNLKKEYNAELENVLLESGNIEIFDLTEENLKSLGFLDQQGWPTEKMMNLLNDIEKVFPIFMKDKVKFWDPIYSRFSIFNLFLKDNENE